MNSWKNGFHCATLAYVLALGGVNIKSLTAQTDQLFNQKGAPTSGTVSSMTPDEVVMSVGNSERRFLITDIRRISFADDPNELKRVRESVANGQLEAAAEDLKKIDASTLRRDFVKLDYEFYKAYCDGKLALAAGGDKQAATNQLRAFITATKGNNYHAYEAAELLGDLAMAMDNPDSAGKFYAFLARSAIPEYQTKAGVLEGKALFAQKKFPDALKKFEGVIGNSSDDIAAARQKLFATLGKASCLAETGKADEGIRLAEEIIQKHDEKDVQLFARAYNTIGFCHNAAKRPKDALRAYLFVHLIFFSDAESHAESLYYLTKLWAEMNKTDQSVKARGILTTRYAGTLWARKS